VGTLLFRVGQADEPLHRHGATHLVEHLALSAQAMAHLPHNGSVDATTTSFVAAGAPDEVATFLTSTAAALGCLPWDRLATEVRILETEASQRGRPAIGTAMALRYGNRGYGMPGLPELGLHVLDAGTLDAWRRTWFTRGNAVLCLSGPPPSGIDLSSLPDGPHRPPPEPEPLVGQPFPCWYPGPPGTVLVFAALERSTAATAALAVAVGRLRQRLRHEEGRSYTVAGEEQVLTSRWSHGVLVADCLPDEAESVRDVCIAELHRLGLQGPSDDELVDLRLRLRRVAEDPGRALSEAQDKARDLLLGRASPPVEDRLAEIDALGPGDVAAASDQALRGAVWVVPHHVGMSDRRVHPVVSGSSREVAGATHRRPGTVGPHHPDRLVIGDEGISLHGPEARVVTVRWTQVAAVQHWIDGGRTIWGDDGFVIPVHGAVPHERVVPMSVPLGTPDLGSPEPEGPAGVASDPPRAPRPTPAAGARLARRSFALVVDAVLGAGALLAAVVAVGMAVQPNDDMDAGAVGVVVVAAGVVAAVFGSTFWRRRRARARADADDARAAVVARTVPASPASGYQPPRLPAPAPTPWAAYGVVAGLTGLAVVVGLVAGGDAGARLARLAVMGGIAAAVVVDRRRD
jgi:hypothetical protein